MSRRCGSQGPPAARLAKGKQNGSKFRAGSSCTRRPFYLFNMQNKAEFLNLQKRFFSLEHATLTCRMKQKICSRCQQLSGGKHGPCHISCFFPGWHGPSARVTATCAATAVWVCPMLFIPLPFTTNWSNEEQGNQNDTFPPKALLLANLSVFSSSCNTLLLIVIN